MSNDLLATVLVLSSAFLHAVTNLLVKSDDDPLLVRGFMSAVSCLVALPLLPAVPAPTAAAWPVLIASVLVHALYPFLIAAAYRRGDLSVIFPIARGISPLGVAALLALSAAAPTAEQLAGVGLILLGILLLILEPARSRQPLRLPAVAYACATGLVVAVYTFLDGSGVRLTDTILSYIVWLVVLDGAFSASVVAAVRRGAVASFVRRRWRQGLAAALLGLLNFGMALYALGIGAMVEIAAMRETSVVFAALLGAYFLGEPHAARRVAAAAVVACGIVTCTWLR